MNVKECPSDQLAQSWERIKTKEDTEKKDYDFLDDACSESSESSDSGYKMNCPDCIKRRERLWKKVEQENSEKYVHLRLLATGVLFGVLVTSIVLDEAWGRTRRVKKDVENETVNYPASMLVKLGILEYCKTQFNSSLRQSSLKYALQPLLDKQIVSIQQELKRELEKFDSNKKYLVELDKMSTYWLHAVTVINEEENSFLRSTDKSAKSASDETDVMVGNDLHLPELSVPKLYPLPQPEEPPMRRMKRCTEGMTYSPRRFIGPMPRPRGYEERTQQFHGKCTNSSQCTPEYDEIYYEA